MNTWMKATVGAAALATSLVTGSSSEAAGTAGDFFLKIEGVNGTIDGESADSKHKGELDVLSWSWGIANTAPAGASGGAGAGRAVFHDITFSKRIDASSPKLFLACATGEHLRKVTLVVRKAGKDQQEYLKITLTDVLISSFHNAVAGEQQPVEQFTLNFTKVEYDYKPLKADGSLGTAVHGGWDLKANVKL